MDVHMAGVAPFFVSSCPGILQPGNDICSIFLLFLFFVLLYSFFSLMSKVSHSPEVICSNRSIFFSSGANEADEII